MRVIECINDDGLSARFGRSFSPWKLTDVDGLYQVNENVYTSENTMTNGSTYQGSTTKMRNIVLHLVCRDRYKYCRQFLYDVFKVQSEGTLIYEESGERRTIKYHVENIDPDSMGNLRAASVSLLCPDPYFESDQDITVVIAGWESGWHFPHEWKAEGEPFGEKSAEKLKTVENDSAADHIGMTIRISASGKVTNPSVTRVESTETIKIGTSAHLMEMGTGDEIMITTGVNNKHVYLIRNGKQTEINEYLDESSVFLQLMRGKNTIGYNADSGADYMRVTIQFRYKFPGV